MFSWFAFPRDQELNNDKLPHKLTEKIPRLNYWVLAPPGVCRSAISNGGVGGVGLQVLYQRVCG